MRLLGNLALDQSPPAAWAIKDDSGSNCDHGLVGGLLWLFCHMGRMECADRVILNSQQSNRGNTTMFFYLLLLFTVVPFVELTLLLWLAGKVGVVNTLLLILFTGVLGASLARWQGLRTTLRIRQEMAQGKVPGEALVDGALILVAGAVLLTPGILTDALGFALLIPVIRHVFKRTALNWIQRNARVQQVHYRSGFGPQPDFTTGSAGDRIVDAKVIETHVVDPENQSP